MKRSPQVAIVGQVFLILGLVFLLVGGAFGAYAALFTVGAVTTEGTVIRLASRPGHSTSVAPVVRFRTEAGQEVEFRHFVYSSLPVYQEGQTVPVLYRPARPDRAIISAFTALWLFPTIFGGIGFAFGLGGALFVLANRRAAKTV
jgi:hypothetical protein